jgi:hypothetical protein
MHPVPQVTLEILRQASALGIFAVWLQPGAEDDAVLKFIANASSTVGGTSYIYSLPFFPSVVHRDDNGTNTGGPCPGVSDPDAPDLISMILRRA